jgi:hypothetical protein
MKRNPNKQVRRLYDKITIGDGAPTKLRKLIVKMLKEGQNLHEAFTDCYLAGQIISEPRNEAPRHIKENHQHVGGRNRTTTNAGGRNQGNHRNQNNGNSGGQQQHAQRDQSNECKGCGRAHSGVCNRRDHPDWNDTDLPWAESPKGRAWKSLNGNSQDRLPYNMKLDTQTSRGWSVYEPQQRDNSQRTNGNSQRSNNNGNARRGNGNGQRNGNRQGMQLINTSRMCYIKSYTLSTLQVNPNMDTGARDGNYISRATAQWLRSQRHVRYPCNSVICSCFNECKVATNKYCFNLNFYNELTHVIDSISICAKEIDTHEDIIIGRPTINKYNLQNIMRSRFEVENDEADASEDRNLNPNDESTTAESFMPRTKEVLLNITEYDPSKEYGTDNTLTLTGEVLEDIDVAVNNNYHDNNNNDNNHDDDNNITDQPGVSDTAPQIITDDPELKAELEKLCKQYSDIFSKSILPDPAIVPPLQLKVDENAWKSNKSNKRPPRLQTIHKQHELRRHIESLLKTKAIRPSQATAYSQVLLVPKPNSTEYRLCIDYRELNKVSDSMDWPIPRIDVMLRRLGSHRSKYFAKFDFTQGYFQTPLSESCKIFTAFITFMGIFEWNRTPMGLKKAGSYFQSVMSTIVLAGLMYIICELYIDDVVVHGKDKETYIKNLITVFKRFRKHKVTLNPKKCVLGLTRIEYVGHVLDEHGLSFSDEKIRTALDFELPSTQKGLKSYIGLINYFHEHIHNCSVMLRPLQQMVKAYKPNRKLFWTPDTMEAFNATKEALENLPTLFFIDDHSPIFIETDASDYGYGAYMYQRVNGYDRPIIILSKTFTPQQLRWSTPEKEAFIIWYALRKWDYLIRDTKFTLRTDHKNLTFIRESGSAKVHRWFLDIQEYDIIWEHIKGETNIVADDLSRFCPAPDKEIIHALHEFKLPRDKWHIIATYHNSAVGHHGVDRTYNKLKANNHEWEYMRENIRKFIDMCPCCQKMSYLKIPIHTSPFTNATYRPMERLNIDTIGPLPADEDGNKYIIVIIDTFTRVTELYAAKNTTAQAAAHALLDHVCRYAAAAQLLSDNGSQYVNRIINELTKLMGTEQVFTLAYSKEENAIVERANKEVMRHLRNILFEKNIYTQWKSYLPLVRRIINTEINESIGVSPYQLLYGNGVQHEPAIFHPSNNSSSSTDNRLSDYTADMLYKQATVLALAAERQRKKDQRHIAAFNSTLTEFPINSYVLVTYPEGPPTKLHPIKKGPFKVLDFEGANYSLLNLVTNKNENHHVTRLKTFEYDNLTTDPRQIANRDYQVWDVEEILEHSGDIKKLSTLDFKVKWIGWDTPNWLPWKELRNNPILHAYLRKQNLRKLIPKEHRQMSR